MRVKHRQFKRDRNEAEIVAALEKIGCRVSCIASEDGFPDLVCSLGGKLALLEIKQNQSSPLTPAQVEWHREWQRHSHIVWTAEQALEIMTK